MEVRLLLLFSIQLLKKKTSELWLCTEKLLYLHLTSNFNTIYLKAGSIFPLQYRKSSEDKFHVPKFCQESGLYGYCQGIQNIYNIYSQLLFSTYTTYIKISCFVQPSQRRPMIHQPEFRVYYEIIGSVWKQSSEETVVNWAWTVHFWNLRHMPYLQPKYDTPLLPSQVRLN